MIGPLLSIPATQYWPLPAPLWMVAIDVLCIDGRFAFVAAPVYDVLPFAMDMSIFLLFILNIADVSSGQASTEKWANAAFNSSYIFTKCGSKQIQQQHRWCRMAAWSMPKGWDGIFIHYMRGIWWQTGRGSWSTDCGKSFSNLFNYTIRRVAMRIRRKTTTNSRSHYTYRTWHSPQQLLTWANTRASKI